METKERMVIMYIISEFLSRGFIKSIIAQVKMFQVLDIIEVKRIPVTDFIIPKIEIWDFTTKIDSFKYLSGAFSSDLVPPQVQYNKVICDLDERANLRTAFIRDQVPAKIQVPKDMADILQSFEQQPDIHIVEFIIR